MTAPTLLALVLAVAALLTVGVTMLRAGTLADERNTRSLRNSPDAIVSGATHNGGLDDAR